MAGKRKDKQGKVLKKGETQRKAYTLNEQIERYLRTKIGLADSIRENYKSDILLFYNMLIEQDLSVGTIKIIHKIIRPALQLACDDNVIAKNPADGCTKEYTEDMEKKYALTFEEEEEFLDRIRIRPRMKR